MNPENNLNLILKLIIQWLEKLKQSYHYRVIQKPVVVPSLPFFLTKRKQFWAGMYSNLVPRVLLGGAEESGWGWGWKLWIEKKEIIDDSL